MVSHDFTPGGQEDPRIEALYAVHKSRWLARYMQDVGIKIIPNITWRDGDEDFLRNTVLATLPVGIPVIAMQLQTLDENAVAGGVSTYLRHIKLVFDTLRPQGAILYLRRGHQGLVALCVRGRNGPAGWGGKAQNETNLVSRGLDAADERQDFRSR